MDRSALASIEPPPYAGLCASCTHARTIESSRGSRFVLCERSLTDAAFPRYPALPVLACAGYERLPAATAR